MKNFTRLFLIAAATSVPVVGSAGMLTNMLIGAGVKVTIKVISKVVDNADDIQSEEFLGYKLIGGSTSIGSETVTGSNSNKNITGVEVEMAATTLKIVGTKVDVSTSSTSKTVNAFGVYHDDHNSNVLTKYYTTALRIYNGASIKASATGNEDSYALGIYSVNWGNGYLGPEPVSNSVEDATLEVHGYDRASAAGLYGGRNTVTSDATVTVSSESGKAYGVYVLETDYFQVGEDESMNENRVELLSGTFNVSVTSGNKSSEEGEETLAVGLFSDSGEIGTLDGAVFNVENKGTSAGNYAYGLYLKGNTTVEKISDLEVNVSSAADFAGGIIIDTAQDEDGNVFENASVPDMENVKVTVVSTNARAVGIAKTGDATTKVGTISGSISVSAAGEVFGYVIGRDISGDSDSDSDKMTPGGVTLYNGTTKDSSGFDIDWENITLSATSTGNQSGVEGSPKGTAAYGFYVGGDSTIDTPVKIKEMNVTAAGAAYGIYTTENGNFYGTDKTFSSSFNITSTSGNAYGLYAHSEYAHSELGAEGGIYGDFTVKSTALDEASGAYGIYVSDGGNIGDIYGNFVVSSENGVATGIFLKNETSGNFGTFYGNLEVTGGLDNSDVFGLIFGRNDVSKTQSVGIYNATDQKNDSSGITIGAGASVSMGTTGDNSAAYGLYATGQAQQMDLNYKICASATSGNAYGVYLKDGAGLTASESAGAGAISETGNAYAIYVEEEAGSVSVENTSVLVSSGKGNVYGILYGATADETESVGLYSVTNKNSSGISTGANLSVAAAYSGDDATQSAYAYFAAGKLIGDLAYDLSAEAASATAVALSLDNSAASHVSGNLSAKGNDASAVVLKNGASIKKLTGEISATTENGIASGIVLSGTATIESVNSQIALSSTGSGHLVGISVSSASSIDNPIEGSVSLESYGTEALYGLVYGKDVNDGSSVAFLNTETGDSSGMALASDYKITLSDKSGAADRVVYGIYAAGAGTNLSEISGIELEINSESGTAYGIYVEDGANISAIKDLKIDNVSVGICVDNATVGTIGTEITSVNPAQDESSVIQILNGGEVESYSGKISVSVESDDDEHHYGIYVGSGSKLGSYTGSIEISGGQKNYAILVDGGTVEELAGEISTSEYSVGGALQIRNGGHIESVSGKITVEADSTAQALTISGGTVGKITADATFSATGSEARGIFISSDGGRIDTFSGEVNATSTSYEAYGMFISGPDGSIGTIDGTITVKGSNNEHVFGVYVKQNLEKFAGTINIENNGTQDAYGLSFGHYQYLYGDNPVTMGVFNIDPGRSGDDKYKCDSSGIEYDWSKLNISVVHTETEAETPYRAYGVYAENTLSNVDIGGSLSAEARGNAYALYLADSSASVHDLSGSFSATTHGDLGSRANTIYAYSSSQITGKISGEVSISAENGDVFGLAYDNDVNCSTPTVINSDYDSVAVYTHWNSSNGDETWSSSGIGIDFQKIRLNVHAVNGNAYGIRMDKYTNIADSIGGSIVASSEYGASYGIVNDSTNAINIADGAKIAAGTAIETAGNVNFVNAYNTGNAISVTGALNATQDVTVTVNEGVSVILNNTSSVSGNISLVNNGTIEFAAEQTQVKSREATTSVLHTTQVNAKTISGNGEIVLASGIDVSFANAIGVKQLTVLNGATLRGNVSMSEGAKLVLNGALALDAEKRETVSLGGGTIELSGTSSLTVNSLTPGEEIQIFRDGEVAGDIVAFLKRGGSEELATYLQEGSVIYDATSGLSVRAVKNPSETLATLGENDFSASFKSWILDSSLEVMKSLGKGAVNAADISGFDALEEDPLFNELLAGNASAARTILDRLSPRSYAAMVAMPAESFHADARSISARLEQRRDSHFAQETPWEFFAQAQGTSVDNKTASNAPTFEFDTYGVLAGADYQADEATTVGLALGMSTGEAKIHNNGGKIESTDFRITGFAGKSFENCFVNAGAQLGYASYDVKRKTDYGNANGDTTGLSAGVFADAGAVFAISEEQKIFAAPYIGLAYMYTQADAFSESGSDKAFDADDISGESLRARVGCSFSWGFDLAEMPWRLGLDLAYSHDFLGDEIDVDVSAKSGERISETAQALPEDIFSIGPTLNVDLSAIMSVYAGYSFSTGTDSYVNHSANAGFRMRF